jgi:hypothetical protein
MRAQVASFGPLAALLVALVLTLLGFVRGALALQSLVLTLWPRCPLLALGRRLRWLLRLTLGSGARLLRRCLDRCGPLRLALGLRCPLLALRRRLRWLLRLTLGSGTRLLRRCLDRCGPLRLAL